jgi:hypothetical protein
LSERDLIALGEMPERQLFDAEVRKAPRLPLTTG